MNKRHMREGYLKELFVQAIKSAKKQNNYIANAYLNEIIGATRYMWISKEICFETKERIYKIVRLIKRRYHLY